jgi:maltokinase
MTGLAALVAAAPGSLVLPAGDRRAQVDVPEPLRLLDAADLGTGRYVAVVEDAAGGRWTVPLVTDGPGVRRAVPGDGVAEALVRGLADVRRMRSGRAPASTPEGTAIQGDRSFVASVWHAEEVEGERGIAVDQTNESVVVGDRAMVKWAVHLPPAGVRGAQPAADRLAALAEAGFTETPRPWGLLHRASPDGATLLLASVTSYLEGAEDGWDWAVSDVDAATTRSGGPSGGYSARSDLQSGMDRALEGPRRVGALTARMHVALSAHGAVAATADDVARWEADARAELAEALALVDGEEGERLRARADRIAAAYDGLAQHVGTPLIPVHGDYHVGQILRTPSADPTLRFDYAVTDFDGNPVRPPEQRSDPQPAALDAVGMLASLDHVGRVVLMRTEGADPHLVRTWIAAAQEAFRHEYADTLARLRHADLLDEALAVPLRLQQEVREFLYAAKHLPHWRYVPDGALRDLLPDV